MGGEREKMNKQLIDCGHNLVGSRSCHGWSVTSFAIPPTQVFELTMLNIN